MPSANSPCSPPRVPLSSGRAEIPAGWSNIHALGAKDGLRISPQRDGAAEGLGPGKSVVISRAIHDGDRLLGGAEAILQLDGEGGLLRARHAAAREAAMVRAAIQRAETADVIADTVDIVLWSMDARTRRWIHLSPSIIRITGHPRETFLDRPDAWLDLVHPDDRARAREAFAGLPAATAVEYRMRTASGGEIVLRDSASAVMDAHGNVTRYDGMAVDVTRQKRTEAALDEARRVANLGTWQIHLADQRLEWSPEVFPQFGVDPEHFEVTLATVMPMIHPDDRAIVDQKLALARHGGEADFDFRVMRPDGKTAWLWSEARLGRDAAGDPVRIYGDGLEDPTPQDCARDAAVAAEQGAADLAAARLRAAADAGRARRDRHRTRARRPHARPWARPPGQAHGRCRSPEDRGGSRRGTVRLGGDEPRTERP